MPCTKPEEKGPCGEEYEIALRILYRTRDPDMVVQWTDGLPNETPPDIKFPFKFALFQNQDREPIRSHGIRYALNELFKERFPHLFESEQKFSKPKLGNR